jgi:hypothetical protein
MSDQQSVPFLDSGRLIAGRARPQSARERLDLRTRLRGAIRYGLRHCSRVAVVVTYDGPSGVVIVCREATADPERIAIVLTRPVTEEMLERAYEECVS